MRDLVVITSYFNFTGNKNFLPNFLKFADSLREQNVPLYVVEISNGTYEVPEEFNVIRFKTDSVLWHKEASLNLLVSRTNLNAKKIAWIDADIIIEDNEWADKASKLLDQYEVIQLAGSCKFLDEHGEIAFSKETCGKAYVEKRENYNRFDIYHLGLCWAANKSFFDKVGLFEYDVTGGGDSISFVSCIGKIEELHSWKKRVTQMWSPSLWNKTEEYNKKCFEHVKGNVGCLDVEATHLYHSEYKNRNYVAKYEALNDFDVDEDLIKNEHGVLEWSTEKKIPRRVKEYFMTKDFAVEVEAKDPIPNGWGRFDKIYSAKKEANYGKINLGSQPVFSSHRSGWQYAIDALAPLHNENGVLFDGFLEKNFAWHYDENVSRKIIPYEENWVGFFHNPPFSPEWFFGSNSLDKIIKKKEFLGSMDKCLGLFSLSTWMEEYLRNELGVPVSTIMHPSEIPPVLFDIQRFERNQDKKIVMIGYWLRKLNSISALPLDKNSGYKKIRLMPYSHENPKRTIESLRLRERDEYNITVPKEFEENTFNLDRLKDYEYDQMLCENIVFLDLYTTSANNAVIESIARGTPILINRLPATEEYLGKDYPFYFESWDEAAQKALDFDLVKTTHEYIMNCGTRKKLTAESFRESFMQSEVYKLI